MKYLFLILLFSCSHQYVEEEHDEEELALMIEQNSIELKESITAFEKSLRELEDAICREYFEDKKADPEFPYVNERCEKESQ